MDLLRRSNVRDLTPFRDDFLAPFETFLDKFFDDFNKPSGALFDKVRANAGYPKMNVIETGKLAGTSDEDPDQWIIQFSIPGCKAEDIEVELCPLEGERGQVKTNLVLTGRMSSDYASPEGSMNYIRELRQSSFRREVTLPSHVEGEPNAILKDGILTLAWDLPEVEQAQPRKFIEIKEEE